MPIIRTIRSPANDSRSGRISGMPPPTAASNSRSRPAAAHVAATQQTDSHRRLVHLTRVCEDEATMANPSQQLAVRLSMAIQRAYGEEFAGTDPVVRRSTQAGSDYQANVAMGLGKRV